ncbi:MAG: hypothetical protein K8T89_15840 [Planctomycetes bacterium]|nr:hypothetical protein [Planctomycetota bacterium]
MAKKIRCHCKATAGCNLCQGTGFYMYEPGPLGWQPFVCPRCEGKRTLEDSTAPEGNKPCPTCAGAGKIDPANPPAGGMWDTLCKIFIGA